MSRKRRRRGKPYARRCVQVITEAQAGFPHAMLMRDGARKILKDYADPPEDGTLVPRGWVEENMLSLTIAADLEADYEARMDRAVSEMIGDVSNWKPTGILNALPSPDVAT